MNQQSIFYGLLKKVAWVIVWLSMFLVYFVIIYILKQEVAYGVIVDQPA
jgi:hypothetical protein